MPAARTRKTVAGAARDFDAAPAESQIVFDTAVVARTLDRLIAGRLHDLELLKTIAQDMNDGMSGESLHRQLLALAKSAREAFDSLQESREILVGLHREASGGEIIAAVDNITGLPNGMAFGAELARQFGNGTDSSMISLMLIEIGALQKLAAEASVSAANNMVRRFSAILRKSVKRSDFVARIGPSHFAIIFPDLLPEQAIKIAFRIHDAIAARLSPKGEPLIDMLSVTVGIAGRTEAMTASDALVQKAQEALIMARKQGTPAIYVA
jgi:diguanylate cyclase (GGDEF)-like protein